MSRVDQSGTGGPDRWQVGGIETVDDDGRIKIPEGIRTELGLTPKDRLHLGYEYGTHRRVLAGCEIVDPEVNDLDSNTLYGAANRFRYTIPGQQRAEKPGLDHLVAEWRAVPADARLARGQTFVFVYPVAPDEPNWCYLVPRSSFDRWLSDPAETRASIAVDAPTPTGPARSRDLDDCRWQLAGRVTMKDRRIGLADDLLSRLGISAGDRCHWGVDRESGRAVLSGGPIDGDDTTTAGDTKLLGRGDGYRVTVPAQLRAPEPESKTARMQWQSIANDAKFEFGADVAFVYRDDESTDWCYVVEKLAFSEWVSPPGTTAGGVTTATDSSLDRSARFGSFPKEVEENNRAQSAEDEPSSVDGV